MNKTIKQTVALLLLAVLVMTAFTGCSKAGSTDINIGVLKGPTGIGAVSVMDKADSGEYEHYHFTLTTEGTDIAAMLTNGDLDIGAMPTNLAANLYNKSGGAIQMIAINCLGVLYILENGSSISSVSDLAGQTIYANGQGANPEYVLIYILRANGLEPGIDVEVIFKEPSEITALMVSGEAEVCMLPVPAATTVCMKNTDVRTALDLTEEYNNVSADGSVLTMGCLVARTEFIESHPEEIALFLERYQSGIEEVLSDIDSAAELAYKYEITGSSAIAKKAIPDCSIVCITGADMQPAIEGYFQVLYDAAPASIGGSIPANDFYYTK